MPYVREGNGRGSGLAAPPFLSLAGLIVCVFFALRVPSLTLRFSFYFLSGVFGMGMVHGVRRLLDAKPTRFLLDAEKISWSSGAEAEVLPWEDIVRCMLVEPEGGGLSIIVKTDDARILRVPDACLPPVSEEILGVLRSEVLPRHAHLRVSLNETAVDADGSDPA
jgi:hypothetical protein